MRLLKQILLVLLVAAVVGCDDGPTLPPTTSGGGWIIQTEFFPAEGAIMIVGDVGVTGAWQSDGAGAVGDASPFTVVTNGDGLAAVANGRVPATWKLTWAAGGPLECDGHTATATPGIQGALEELICFEVVIPTAGFYFSPNPLYRSAPPATSTIHGAGFSQAHGMPLVQYYNLQGVLVSQDNATVVASDGTWVQAPTPNISTVALGTYAGAIKNANGSGGWNYIGSAAVRVALIPPPPPGGGCSATPTKPKGETSLPVQPSPC
jgi:hypothetical protein